MGKKRVGIRPASQTSIEIRFTFAGQRCYEYARLKPSTANLNRAERFREDILNAIERGTFDYAATFPDSKNRYKFAKTPADKMLIKYYLEDWLDEKKDMLNASTWHDYRKIIKNILIPRFGVLTLGEFKRHHMKAWCKSQGSDNKRIKNVVSIMRSALNTAVSDEVMDANPLLYFRYKKLTPPKPKNMIDPFDAYEQRAICEAAKAMGQPATANLLKLAFWTGLRPSEMIAVEWGDIDWRRSTIRINKVKTETSKSEEAPKTKAGYRDVKLLPLAIDALTAQKAHSYLHPSGKIFLHPRTGKPYSGPQVLATRIWKPILLKAKVRYRNLYQTRHTYTSMMASAGEPVRWIADQMGHSNWLMIATVYAHWMLTADPEAGLKADRLFGRKSPRF